MTITDGALSIFSIKDGGVSYGDPIINIQKKERFTFILTGFNKYKSIFNEEVFFLLSEAQ